MAVMMIVAAALGPMPWDAATLHSETFAALPQGTLVRGSILIAQCGEHYENLMMVWLRMRTKRP
jgi:hypothetical protein